MASARVQEERVRRLNDVEEPRSGDYVLYWMQQSQRAGDNHALEYAVQRANDLDCRLLVTFGLTDDYPEANLVVPVELASSKREHAARTLRPKVTEYLEDFLVGLNPTKLEEHSEDIE